MKNILILLFLLAIFSCYNQEITVYPDYSGEISYNITINQEFNHLIQQFNQDFSFLQFNIDSLKNPADLKKQISQTGKIEIIQHKAAQTSTNENYLLTIRFDQISHLIEQLPQQYFKNKIYQEKKIVYLSTLLTLDFMGDTQLIKTIYQQLNQEKRKYIDELAGLIKLKLSYHCFSEIMRYNHQKNSSLDREKRVITYEFTLLDLLKAKNNLEILVLLKK